MTEPRLRVERVPVIDTGVGREMGYANDAEFIAAAQAEREVALADLTPAGREKVEQFECDLTRRVLFGD